MTYMAMIAALLLATAVELAPDSPGREYKQPQLAASGELVAVAFGSGNGVYVAVSRDRGRTFSKPVLAGEVPKLALGRHRGPRLAIDGETIVVSAVNPVDLVSWRSPDGGQTWSGPVRVNDVAESAREGLHGLAAGNGVIFATWLDLRTGAMRLEGSVSRDGGRTWGKNRVVYDSPDGHICECCHPTARIAGGRLYAMWRNWLGGMRDMYLAVSSDGGETFRTEKLGRGQWPLKACPMDGGGMAIAGDAVYTVWRRDQTIYLARPGEAERELGPGRDAAIAVAGGRVYTAWSSADGLQFRAGGKALPAREGAYVDLVAAGDRVIAAWEHQGRIVIDSLD
jgi:hypothetical protein